MSERKKSWREVDNGRARSAHRRVERAGSSPYDNRANKSYRAELDRFFDSGVASKRIQDLVNTASEGQPTQVETAEKREAVRKVRGAETFDDFVNSVTHLVTNFSLPADAEILIRVLEHPD
ncbi:MAG: hypothetical protein KC561_03085, partial [Myxococcales bacterium]|nr:hypothetical protein [Myxococcales bacterium]